jgi:hypothetical protein
LVAAVLSALIAPVLSLDIGAALASAVLPASEAACGFEQAPSASALAAQMSNRPLAALVMIPSPVDRSSENGQTPEPFRKK